jgi:hypothetical protein
MELRLLWISTIVLGQVAAAFAWIPSCIPTKTRCRPASRLVLWEHAGSQTYHQHLPQYADVQDDHAVTDIDDATTSARVETNTVSTTVATASVARNRASWMDRVQELQEYRSTHGNTLVPKRYKENPALGNWVNKQRQSYRKFLRDEQPCSLTSQRIGILNSVGFCWDASNVTAAASTITTATTQDGESTGGDDAWWSRLRELEHYLDADNSGKSIDVTYVANIPRHDHDEASQPPPHMRAWIREQRSDYQMNLLSVQQSEALSAIDPDWWKSQRQVQWDVRYHQLQVYKQEHGDCCVPISYANKQLANWVHNQRKQYNLRQTGKASDLTTERLQRLQEIGFVWNRWEYEFEKHWIRVEA